MDLYGNDVIWSMKEDLCADSGGLSYSASGILQNRKIPVRIMQNVLRASYRRSDVRAVTQLYLINSFENWEIYEEI